MQPGNVPRMQEVHVDWLRPAHRGRARWNSRSATLQVRLIVSSLSPTKSDRKVALCITRAVPDFAANALGSRLTP